MSDLSSWRGLETKSEGEAADPRPSTSPGECRCACGNLVAKRSARGVEIKCRRCRRVHLIPWEEMAEAPAD